MADGNVETVVPEDDVAAVLGSRLLASRKGVGELGATWADDGTIVYSAEDGLYQVAAHGGDPELVTGPDTLQRQFRRYAQPHVVPGSRVVSSTG